MELFELIAQHQGEKTDAEYAADVGINATTWWFYSHQKRQLPPSVRASLIDYYLSVGEFAIVGALLTYKSTKPLTVTAASTLGTVYSSLVA